MSAILKTCGFFSLTKREIYLTFREIGRSPYITAFHGLMTGYWSRGTVSKACNRACQALRMSCRCESEM